jgi:hypothetical protein
LAGKLTQSDFNRLTWDSHISSLQATLLKPGRRLGGAWIDDFVALGRQVCICEDCNRRYGDWWNGVQYRAMEAVIGDCDGCGEPLMKCVKFSPNAETPNTERVN